MITREATHGSDRVPICNKRSYPYRISPRGAVVVSDIAEILSEPASPETGDPVEDVYYYVTRDWYKGRFPTFYDQNRLPGTKILEDNWKVIRDEILAYYAAKPSSLKPNYTPYGYREEGWKTINLYSYFFRYGKVCKAFPCLSKILETIPGMSMAQIAVLEPNTRIKAHFGDTSVVIRSHLGILIPGGLPELGLQVRRQRVTWKEGKVFAFCIAHRHYAWNFTEQPRIALVVDVFREEYLARRYEIAGKALAAIAMKAAATRVPLLKASPQPITKSTHLALGKLFEFVLFLQRRFGINVDRLISTD